MSNLACAAFALVGRSPSALCRLVSAASNCPLPIAGNAASTALATGSGSTAGRGTVVFAAAGARTAAAGVGFATVGGAVVSGGAAATGFVTGVGAGAGFCPATGEATASGVTAAAAAAWLTGGWESTVGRVRTYLATTPTTSTPAIAAARAVVFDFLAFD